MCLCTALNNSEPISVHALLENYSKSQLEKILGSKFAEGKIPSVLYENVIRSSERKETILLESAGAAYKEPLNELALWLSKKWPIGSQIKVKFLTSFPAMEDKIKQAAKEWENYANIKFEFITNGNAEIRISLNSDGTSWSMIGTDCLKVLGQEVPTMNFGWFSNATVWQEIKGTTLHEFGHALGCIHEHQQPAAQIFWDERAVIRGYQTIHGWNENKIRQNILGSFPQKHVTNSVYDTNSIMHYFFPSYFMLGGTRGLKHNYELSDIDKQFIGFCYPF